VANFLLTHGADVTAVNADGELASDIVEGEKCAELLQTELERLGIFFHLFSNLILEFLKILNYVI
jgi:hypothetical protein